jgi:hypothetical protein
MPADIDVDAGLAVLSNSTTLEPGFSWYTAWGTRI